MVIDHDCHAGAEAVAHGVQRGKIARLTRALGTSVQIGENFNGPEGLSQALAAAAYDLVIVDVARIGGVTGWIQARGIAATAGIEMSSHLMPEISAQLLCAIASAHWLVYVDWADAFLKEPMRIVDGMAVPSARPGAGLDWDEARLHRLETL